MRILIFHGYLLGGTGSNVYSARLAEALVRIGHEVHILSQERHPERHPFIDAAGDWDSGTLRIAPLKDVPDASPEDAPQSRARARCTLYRPDIGTLLPVYVEDRYEGVEARAFERCSAAEIERYLQANVEAVREVVALAAPEVALANHLVMGPAILARALARSLPYAVKVHGSALEYTVKRAPDRFLGHAREGLVEASAILVGSRHTAQSLWDALGRDWVLAEGIERRTRLGPPGVDVHLFAPRGACEAAAGLRTLSSRLAASEAHPQAAGSVAARRSGEADAFARQDALAGRELGRLDPGRGPIVAYVGKLIVSKGVDLLLASWPLVLCREPDAQLVVVGFGALREAVEELTAALGRGDVDAVRDLAHRGRALEGGPAVPLRHLLAFLDSLGPERLRDYLDAAAEMQRSVVFTGRLDHEELAELLPACEALVVPSTFPEAFGMVAAEAAACGALPVSAAHSGLAEVSEALAAAVPADVAPLLRFDVDGAAVAAIAGCVTGWLSMEQQRRAAAREGIVEAVRERWSWEGVARGVIAAAEGRLDGLPRP